MIYDFVAFHEVAEEIADNIETHDNDIEIKDEYGAIKLDWEYYLQSSYNGRCRVVTVRKDDKLVAYSIFFIGVNINHKNIIEATNSALWINKAYRGKIISQLLKKADEYLKELSVMEVNYIFHDKRIGKLLERVDYKGRHTVWSKKL